MAGSAAALQWTFHELKSELLIKQNAFIGPSGGEYMFLRARRVRDPHGITIFPNPKYAEGSIELMGLKNATPAA
eukprot:7202476-Alexandrium_andersonii.AAC.1